MNEVDVLRKLRSTVPPEDDGIGFKRVLGYPILKMAALFSSLQ
jgi:hypothetical protein